MKNKKISVGFVLFILLILSIIYAAISIGYKIKNYGFSLNSKNNVDTWLVEAEVSFETTGEPIRVSLSVPKNELVISSSVNADGYKLSEKELRTRKIITLEKTPKKANIQEKIYYKILLMGGKNTQYTNENTLVPSGATDKPYLSDSQIESGKKLLKMAKNDENNSDFISGLIKTINGKNMPEEARTLLPLKTNPMDIYNALKSILSFDNIPVRMIRGIVLVEQKNFQRPELYMEAYVNGEWKIYSLETGEIGLPNNFLVFQSGGNALLDVAGGVNSNISFSIIKNKYNALFISKYKSELTSSENSFKYSMYNLPIREQNIFKFMTVFPLAILAIVIIRNIIGIKTMGTFTPMLIAMSFIQTGFLTGIVGFSIIISFGLFIRLLLSKLNLLLVPRISSIVIIVILIMQVITVFSYNLQIEIGMQLIFFPLIITAWIIERSVIILEESGWKPTVKQIITTMLVAVLTYWVISSSEIRYIMYVFNELNVVILFLVMLIGTYSGYRLTELIRFEPLAKKDV